MSQQNQSRILDFLTSHGPHLDIEIAEALKMPLTRVRGHVADLSSGGAIICCDTTQFRGGTRIDGISCRVSCYTPPPARGRKPGAKKRAESESLPD